MSFGEVRRDEASLRLHAAKAIRVQLYCSCMYILSDDSARNNGVIWYEGEYTPLAIEIADELKRIHVCISSNN